MAYRMGSSVVNWVFEKGNKERKQKGQRSWFPWVLRPATPTKKMIRFSKALLRDAGISEKILSEFLVCPLSKQSLRLSQDSSSLICDTLGVCYPVVDGIPCLVPKDGKLLETSDSSASDNVADSSPISTK
ncbi:uncharacterized protein [Aristolochia californica]|uniref:uncharacterized protein n=1 Tax=Aristolochia californica TaxID=171875 RepID=UPI0035D73143